MLGELAPVYLIANCCYDADLLVATLAQRGTLTVILPRRQPRTYALVRYAQRQPVERLLSRLKQSRRVAIRYDKINTNFLAFIHLATTVLGYVTVNTP